MKKNFFIALSFAWCPSIFSQEPADALRYSWYIQGGTARQQAIGGAMGSLGGEISAIFVNPAGLGFYKTGDLVITPGYSLLNNKGTFFGRTESSEKQFLMLGTTGIILGNPNTRNRKIKSSAFGMAINNTANFRNQLLYRGEQRQSSLSQKFLEEIRNGNIKDANAVAQNFPFGTSLAFNTYWIDTIGGGSSGNYEFKTRSPVSTGLLQENSITTKGGITELALGGATNYEDKLYIGATVGIPFLHYKRESRFTEADATADTSNKFDFALFSENLTTDGVGINIKAGVIYKPVEFIRLGLTLHSPTYYTLTDKYHASVTTHTENYQGLLTQASGQLTGRKDGEFKYSLITPYRIIVSASYVIREIEDVRKQKGFITADVEYINHKASFFTPDESNNSTSTRDYLKSINKAIDKTYKGTLNFRLGGELKFTTLMARLGGAFYSNPYRNINGEKGNRIQVCGGLGYRNKGVFIDLAYSYTISKDVHFPYRLQYSPYSGASVKSKGGIAVLTVGFKI